MSFISSIRSYSHLNSEITKKVDNVSILNNKNFKNVDIAIINHANQKYTAYIVPKSIYNQEKIVYANKCKNEKTKTSISDFFSQVFNNSNVTWHILRSPNFSSRTVLIAKKLHKSFKKLLHTKLLEQKFLDNLRNSTVFLNGKQIPFDQAPDIMNELQQSITDYESRQLISNYVHPDVLQAGWENLSMRYPDVKNRISRNVHFTYEIDKISPDVYKVAVTKTADLDPSYLGDVNEISKYGVRAAMIITKNSNPEMRYSFFVQ